MPNGLPMIAEGGHHDYTHCEDELLNASFLSSPTRLELLMSRVKTLIEESNELGNNEMEMLKGLRTVLLTCVEQIIGDLEAEITKMQDIRCETLRNALSTIDKRFNNIKPNENELKNFSLELQVFVNDINASLECVPGKAS